MVGLGAQTQTNAFHIAKLEPRFHSLMSALHCHENSMARFAELGVVSIQGLETLADDRAALRTFLKTALGLDPAQDPQVEHTLEAGRITSAWEQTKKRSRQPTQNALRRTSHRSSRARMCFS